MKITLNRPVYIGLANSFFANVRTGKQKYGNLKNYIPINLKFVDCFLNLTLLKTTKTLLRNFYLFFELWGKISSLSVMGHLSGCKTC